MSCLKVFVLLLATFLGAGLLPLATGDTGENLGLPDYATHCEANMGEILDLKINCISNVNRTCKLKPHTTNEVSFKLYSRKYCPDLVGPSELH